ncbi:MAG: DUF3127 domain-containing protein [Bacteroidetes bacterium]|nr:MAG: DUF3127 domain-containing protein [Bacteroidota bacterium]
MALDITGKIIQKLNKTEGVSKAGKAWSKQEFVIETQETYPKKVMISTMNEKVNELERYNVGDVVTASLNLESREYNGRWYTDARAWKIQGNGTAAQTAEADPFHPDNEPSFNADSASDDLPF